MSDPRDADLPPSRPFARAGRDVIEGVLLRLGKLPARSDRGAIHAAVADALSALARLDRSDLDDASHLDWLRAAVAAVGEARSLTSAAEALGGGAADLSKSLLEVEDALGAAVEPTIAAVVARQDRLLRMGKTREPERPKLAPFRVCGGAPHVFTLPREPLPLILGAAVQERSFGPAAGARGSEPVAAAGSSEEGDPAFSNTMSLTEPEPLGEEALFEDRPGAARALFADDSEAFGMGRLLRDTMEEIGSLGMLRAPAGPSVAWGVGLGEIEERLLADVDAFMALADPEVSEDPGESRLDAIGELVAWAGDAMVPDPVRAFSRTFLLGCVAGEDAARAAVMAVRSSHPITHEAERDALALAPHPDIAREVARLLADETPDVLQLAADVLRRRREVSFEAVAPLLAHPRPTVREAAARALSVSNSPAAALRLLEEHAGGEEDDSALLGAAEALLVLGSGKGLTLVRDKLEEEAAIAGSLSRQVRGAALRLLGFAGGRSDGALLCRVLRRDPAAALALGWHGDPSVVPALIGALAETASHPAHPAFARALASALHRITGLGRPPGDDGRAPLYVVEPPVDAAFWSARWEASPERPTRPVRLRFGKPFSPLAVVSEAEAGEVSTDVHRELLTELLILSRGASRADPDGWIALQRAALAELGQRFSASRWPEGQWPAGLLFEAEGHPRS